MMDPTRGAVENLENLRYFNVEQLLYDETLKAIEHGRSTCTRMLKDRGLDLEHLVEDGPALLPPGLPVELQDWLTDFAVAETLRKSLERMRQLLPKQENEAAQEPSSPHGVYPILAHAGSVGAEGELQAPVVNQHHHFEEATNTVTLIPQAKPSTGAHAAENLRWRGKILAPRQTGHAVRSPTSVFGLGNELVT